MRKLLFAITSFLIIAGVLSTDAKTILNPVVCDFRNGKVISYRIFNIMDSIIKATAKKMN